LTGYKSGGKIKGIGQKVADRDLFPDPSVYRVLFDVDLFVFGDSKTVNRVIE
jgi:hypothetical protein